LSADADFAVRLFNADGGETPISGNGTRCVAAWLFANSLWSQPEVTILTVAGTKKVILKDRSGNTFRFETEMGKPRLTPGEIPVLVDKPLDRVVGETLQLSDGSINFTASSMGNPHCSIFLDNFDSLDWQTIGAEIERHPRFPERTNVEFIRILDRHTIEVRFWERGVGATLASGTGACGAVVASILNNLAGPAVRVRTETGELQVEWRGDGLVYQTGEVRRVFSGDWYD
jgi:diaminopimelate epimerase